MFRTYLEHIATMRAIQPSVIHFIDQYLPADDFNAYCICIFLCALPFDATWIVTMVYHGLYTIYVYIVLLCILTKYIYIYVIAPLELELQHLSPCLLCPLCPLPLCPDRSCAGTAPLSINPSLDWSQLLQKQQQTSAWKAVSRRASFVWSCHV